MTIMELIDSLNSVLLGVMIITWIAVAYVYVFIYRPAKKKHKEHLEEKMKSKETLTQPRGNK